MTFHGPADAFLLVGGIDLSGDTFQLSDNVEHMLEECRGFRQTYDKYSPVGVARIDLEASGGLYDDRTAGMIAAFQGMGQTRQLVCYGFAGVANGADVTMLDGLFAAIWKRIAKREELTKAHAEYKVSATFYRGRILHGFTAETTDPGNTEAASIDQNTALDVPEVTIVSSSVANPTVVTTLTPHGLITGDVVMIAGHAGSTPDINGQQTVTVLTSTTFTVPVNVTVGGTGGTVKRLSSPSCIADLHVPALTLGGFTSLRVKVRHSTDNVTFADLITFTDRTAVGAERVSFTGVVNRYTAMSWDFIGAGSAQSAVPFVALHRPV